MAATGSDPWWQTDASRCWHPYTQHQLDRDPLPVVGARGAWLEIADGRHLIDAISSWWACLHGHGHHRLVAAAATQAARLDHVLFAGCTHEPAVRLATDLLALAKPLAADQPPLTRVFYSDNGSTAVEVALKAAWQYWLRRGAPQRRRFLALEGGYHGDTFGAMAVGEPVPFFQEFAPLLFEVDRIPADADSLAAAFAAHPGEYAAVILEPLVQGAAGMQMHPPSFLQAVRKVCDQDGALWIADEVMTGFGRTGSVFACAQAEVCPDLMAVAKGLTGGMLPLAATLAREEIYQAFLSEDRGRAFFHGHTFTANPIACAVAHAALGVLREEDTPARLAAIGADIERGLRRRLGAGQRWQIRRTGGIVAVDRDRHDYLAPRGEALRAACRQQTQVLLRPLGEVLYAMPPACLTAEEGETVAEAMAAVLLQVDGR